MEKNMQKNLVADWASDVRAADQKFIRATLYALDQFSEKNNAPLYALIALVNGKAYKGQGSVKGLVQGSIKTKSGKDKPVVLTQFAAPLKRVLDGALPGFKFVYKDGSVSLSAKNGKVDHDKVQGLRMVAAQKDAGGNYVTVRCKAFLDVFPIAPKAEPKAKDAQAVQEALAKYIAKLAKDHGFDVETIKAMATAKPAPKASRDSDAGIAH
jgi:hypothetical protein